MRFAGLRRLLLALCEAALLWIGDQLIWAASRLLAAVKWLRERAR